MDTTYLHIGVILSTLGLSPHGFALGLYPKGLTPMKIFVHPYIPMILPTSSQYGTMVVYPTKVSSKTLHGKRKKKFCCHIVLFLLGKSKKKYWEREREVCCEILKRKWSVFWNGDQNLKTEGPSPSLTILIDWLQVAASSTNHYCQICNAKAKKMTFPSHLVCPNPSKPVDNFKAEDPSLSLYCFWIPPPKCCFISSSHFLINVMRLLTRFVIHQPLLQGSHFILVKWEKNYQWTT